MALRLTVLVSVISIVCAGPVDYHEYQAAPAVIKSYAPAVVKTVAAPVYKQLEHEAPAEYEFSYSVHDEQTGDIKSQKESRKGDVVQGYYELIEPDGYRRLVEYTADAHNGFKAVVHREPTDFKIPQPAPQIHKILAPVSHYAPVAKVNYATPLSAPVAKVSYRPAQVAKTISYAAPITKVVAPIAKYAVPATQYSLSEHESSHVTYNGPTANYHY